MPGIKIKQSYDIIDYPEGNINKPDKIKRYCPICSSVLQEWIFESEWDKEENDYVMNAKPKKIPDCLQCHKCGEIVRLFNADTLSIEKEETKRRKGQ